jgi:hypothetical protein
MTIVKMNFTNLTKSRAIVTKESMTDLSPNTGAGKSALTKSRVRSIAFFEFVEAPALI